MSERKHKHPSTTTGSLFSLYCHHFGSNVHLPRTVHETAASQTMSHGVPKMSHLFRERITGTVTRIPPARPTHTEQQTMAGRGPQLLRTAWMSTGEGKKVVWDVSSTCCP